MSQPKLPEGLVVIVKRECETCRIVVPVIEQLIDGTLPVTVYVQDDPAFPESLSPIHDSDLSISWHYDIETVPTVIRVLKGHEVERTVGWSRPDWEKISGLNGLGAGLPDW
ncbi:MAG: hypothetical protein RL119_446, partial [Actinomycetota bacterium]